MGGQAVSFWVDFYAAQVPALARLAPLTTADIDFVGDRRAVTICAERLDGAAKLPDLDDHTPNTGMVKFVDAAGEKQNIDFIDQPHGLTAREVYRMAVPVRVLDGRGLLDAGEVRAVLRLNERIFTFCLKDRDGRLVHAKHGVDPFEAIVADDDRLPAKFRETRYPQMQRELAVRRAKRGR